MEILGLDIGGTGIKGAPVDMETGELKAERLRVKTPQPPTPEAVVESVAEVIRHFNWRGPVGCGFPAALRRGTVLTATNIDKSWIGRDAEKMIGEASGCPVSVGNDADVAALAEAKFGAGHEHPGVVIVVTLGTGLGTGVLCNGRLVPNTELGQVYLSNGLTGEQFCAESVKKREELKHSEWGSRISLYLKELEKLFYPDLFILGGGGSNKFEKFSPHLTVETKVVPAELRNMAGIIGAALHAHQAQGFGG